MRMGTILLSICLLAPGLAGCSKDRADSGDGPKHLRVLCSTFPMYLFTLNVTAGREDVIVESMLSGGMGCPHDYALTPQDMQKIAAADVFVVNGLGLEAFLGDPVKKANATITVIDTSQGIHDLIQIREENDQAGPNPHLFADPRMAARIVRNIAAELSRIDPAGADTYRKNAQAYSARLDKLADEFVAAGKGLRSTKIVTEHAVLDYLARSAGLQIASVIEETPGQEPSAAEMLALVKTIKASTASAVFTEPQYPAKVARTIAREAGIPVAVLDPVASGPDNPPLDYYETVIRGNLRVLQQTLGEKGK